MPRKGDLRELRVCRVDDEFWNMCGLAGRGIINALRGGKFNEDWFCWFRENGRTDG